MSSDVDIPMRPLAQDDLEVLQLVQEVNEQYQRYLDTLDTDLMEFLSERQDDLELPSYTWHDSLTLTIRNTPDAFLERLTPTG